MHKEINKLESADLDVKLIFPDGERPEAARLVLMCRKSNLTIAEVDMSANDLVNFMARRTIGALEGEARLLNERGRAQLNRERELITVHLPLDVDVFDEEDDLNTNRWASAACDLYGAADFRVTRKRQNYAVSFMFFPAEKRSITLRFLEVVQQQLRDKVAEIAKAAAAKKAEL